MSNTQTKPAHTPQIKINHVTETKLAQLWTTEGQSFCLCDEVHAAHIVKCVNNHEKLTNGIAQLIKFYKNTQGLELPELEALLNEVEP